MADRLEQARPPWWPSSRGPGGLLERLRFSSHGLVMIAVVATLALAGQALNTGFLSPANIGNILAIASVLAIATAGQTLVMVSGAGVDISIGAVMSLGAILTVEIQNHRNEMILPSLAVVLAAGALTGLLNGLGVIKAKVPSLVLTFATASIVESVELIYTKGSPYGKPAPLVSFVGTMRLLPWLPWLVFVAGVVVVVMHFLMNRSVFGKWVYAAGSNGNAADLAGIRTARVRITAFVLCGVFSAFAGFWFAAYNTFMKVGEADYLNMPVLAVVLIGGTTFSGGRGSYYGSLAGAVILTLVTSLLIMVHSTEPIKLIINGLILLVLLAIYNRETAIRQ